MTTGATLYPVVQMITGSTPNGGGTWKWLLHGLDQGILRQNIPVMVQALHFKDYSISPAALGRWRAKPLYEHYNGSLRTAGDYTVSYTGEIFCDSGGFTFMFGSPAGLERFGLSGPNLQEELLKLKIDLGARKVVSLDYPIPPGLERSAAKQRLSDTLDNALRAARFLQEQPQGKRPSLVLPVHGASAQQAGTFTRILLAKLEGEGLMDVVSGLGLGSMVPLRRNHRTAEIVAYVKAVRRTAPELPLHVFGVTGLLIPFLMQAGATSFDSSNYIQKARVLKYVLTEYRETRLPDLEAYPCSCPVCESRDAKKDLATLRAAKGEVEPGQKSQVYAAIALHNLQHDFEILDKAKQHAEEQSLAEYTRELAYRYPRMRALLEGRAPKPAPRLQAPVNDPSAFDLRRKGYRPSKPVLLLLPCASEKPYTAARSYQHLWKKLWEELGSGVEVLEVVFVSGLYGPVPISYVGQRPLLQYDFLLRSDDKTAQQRVRERLERFLERYGEKFHTKVAYLSPPAYRKVVKGLPLELLPEDNRSRFSHYKKENLTALVKRLENVLVSV